MLFNLLTWLYRAFVVKPYETLTGEHFLGEAQNLPGRYSDGQRPRWVKFVGDIGLTLSSAPHLPPGTNIIHRFYAKPPFISDNIGAWIGNDNPAVSARRWVNHFKDELNAFKSIPGRKKAIDGPGNEVGQGEIYAAFCFELAKILYREFDGMLLAAFGASTGSYNEAQAVTAQGLPDRDMIRQQIIRNARILSESHDPLAAQSLQAEVVEILRLEAQNARTIADTYVIPLIREGIPVYLSLHAYASLYPMVWHGDHRQKPQIQQIWNSGARGDIFGLNDFMPASVLDNTSGPPSTYTGFGWIRLLWHFKHNHQIDLKKIGLLITEGGIVDNVGDPGIGTVAAGWRQWVERGLWERLRIGNDSYEMVAARALLYIEQQCRIFLPLLLDMATTPFTDTDHNKGTRWHIEYRTIDVMALFKSLVRALGGLPTEPPPPTGCQISPSGNLAINIRQQPSTDAPIVGELAIADTIEPLATIRDVDGKVWYRTALGFIASFAAIAVSGCEGLPDETPPPDNGEDETMGTLNLVLRDLNPAQMATITAQVDGDLFVNLGDPRTGAESALSKHVGRFWLDWHDGHPGQDFGNNNTFMQRVSGGAVDIADGTLLAHPILKNYINDYQEYWIRGGATGQEERVDNEFFAPHVLISPPINADECPPHLLGLMASIQAHVALRLNNYVAPDSNKTTYRGLHGCYIGRDIGLDSDRAAFLSDMRPVLEAVRNFGGVYEMKRKVDKPLTQYRRSEVLPDADITWLKANGFGSVSLLLSLEWVDGYQAVGMSAKQAADSLWLLHTTVQTYANLDIAVSLVQDGERFNPDGTPDWGNTHNLQGAAMETFLAYKSGAQTPPNVAWLAESPGNGNGGDPEPDPPSGCIPLPFARMLARELRPFLVK